MLSIAGISKESVVDGPGLRCVVFTQGCPHHCPGCHNPKTHPMKGGTPMELEKLAELWRQNPLIEGLTISGGEPFMQARDCAKLAKIAKEDGLHIIVYSGFKLEKLQSAQRSDWNELLSETDILIDSPFLLSERSLELAFRGSRNQRIWKNNGNSQFLQLNDEEFTNLNF